MKIALCFIISLSFFLLGLFLVKLGLEAFALSRVKAMISQFTSTPAKGMLTGAATTFLIQSSSAVTVITISLVNSGLMTLHQAIGIVLGTNIGTCITAFFFTFDILSYFPGLVLLGILFMLVPKITFRNVGITLVGFGIVFASLLAIQYSLIPLKHSPQTLYLIQTMGEDPASAILAGAIFTALIQSSSAVTGIVIALALQGLISLEGGIGIILGSNIGTCITAILASITANRTAKQVAFAHVLLNILGVIIIFPFIRSFTMLVESITPYLAAQIAWAQFIFNLLSSLIALPFAKKFANLLEKIFKA